MRWNRQWRHETPRFFPVRFGEGGGGVRPKLMVARSAERKVVCFSGGLKELSDAGHRFVVTPRLRTIQVASFPRSDQPCGIPRDLKSLRLYLDP
jgi:hypothetical protein